MNKLFLLVFLISLPVWAQTEMPVMTTVSPEEERYHNPHKNHWLVTFGFEGLKYDLPYSYEGVEEKFSPGDVELWGGRIGVGGEIYLGSGFVTTTKIEGYYVGTLFTRRMNAGPDDEDEVFAYTKRNGSVFGVDAVQSIGYLFNMKTKNPFMEEWVKLTVEPFIEAGFGVAHAYNRLSYSYNTGPTGTDEGYRARIRDQLINSRIGAGVNFTSNIGYFLYLRGHVNNFDITTRRTRIFTKPNQAPGSTEQDSQKDASIDPVITYAIGGGYKF